MTVNRHLHGLRVSHLVLLSICVCVMGMKSAARFGGHLMCSCDVCRQLSGVSANACLLGGPFWGLSKMAASTRRSGTKMKGPCIRPFVPYHLHHGQNSDTPQHCQLTSHRCAPYRTHCQSPCLWCTGPSHVRCEFENVVRLGSLGDRRYTIQVSHSNRCGTNFLIPVRHLCPARRRALHSCHAICKHIVHSQNSNNILHQGSLRRPDRSPRKTHLPFGEPTKQSKTKVSCSRFALPI